VNTNTPCRNRYGRRHGLSLVETMISLVITATLLTAVGAAYTGSVHAVQINDQFFRASQTARVSLNQLLSELRQSMLAELQDVNTLNVQTASGKLKTYKYDAANQKLLLTITDTFGVTTNYTAARNVSALAFTGDSGNVTITMTITAGNNKVTLGGSVIPRRVVTYN
jgi:Tfp pilus assembly protein PilW